MKKQKKAKSENTILEHRIEMKRPKARTRDFKCYKKCVENHYWKLDPILDIMEPMLTSEVW